MSPKSRAVVYCGASGFAGYYVQCGLDLALGVWYPRGNEDYSSTFKEILAVKFVPRIW